MEKNLTIPGEFFVNSTNEEDQIDPNQFIDRLRLYMRNLQPTVTKTKNNDKIFIPKTLDTCSHVFIRVNKIKPSLHQPYEGPFLVERRFRKYFVVNINGKNTSVSIDRIKPAFGILSNNTEASVKYEKSVKKVSFK